VLFKGTPYWPRGGQTTPETHQTRKKKTRKGPATLTSREDQIPEGRRCLSIGESRGEELVLGEKGKQSTLSQKRITRISKRGLAENYLASSRLKSAKDEEKLEARAGRHKMQLLEEGKAGKSSRKPL